MRRNGGTGPDSGRCFRFGVGLGKRGIAPTPLKGKNSRGGRGVFQNRSWQGVPIGIGYTSLPDRCKKLPPLLDGPRKGKVIQCLFSPRPLSNRRNKRGRKRTMVLISSRRSRCRRGGHFACRRSFGPSKRKKECSEKEWVTFFWEKTLKRGTPPFRINRIRKEDACSAGKRGEGERGVVCC